ncbi:nuclear transport factor 2 family protein [Pseudomonas lalucatii]|uniref:Nuclear transport factor 2 family protein n=1 Tax=Pseudomonas lalucatii TaxID=1424203 RepID=A0ABS5Q011_9PSED|nr:nuclear transport factor 2 family protein [Pseudomonas lalucatii]MBS7662080.1 nuclear transport factor 2 family protein [Pseudomonas lalucatii]MBS7690477.1 nuclear transport factor 2 family protein [Pseudomonas lalucatii]MBS7726121.1 nuclear transport factor 2 family protein [Pseudomonas lalucatii]QVM88310.1 nuclear transport factor 2 family protein [Pseudomonas lalucatii]
MSLEQRIARLEALEAIRRLKHRYLNACDLKDVECIRDCFAAGEVLIDYGPLGLFKEREAFVALYRELACRDAVIDLHHGANPEIELLSASEAEGRWALWYFNIDASSGATRQLGGFYQDRYRLTEAGWKIVETRFRAHSEYSRPA